jgi:hypothetical protein
VMERALAGLLVAIVVSMLAVPAWAEHNPSGRGLKFEDCTYPDGEPEDFGFSEDSCTYDEDGHIIDHADRFGDGPDFGSLIAIMFFVGLLWSLVPAVLARNIASSREQPTGAATAIGFFGGWLGLAFVYLAMKEGPVFGSGQSTGTSQRSEPAPSPSDEKPAAERLRELTGLRDEGLITSEEFGRRRAEILGEI